MFSSMFRRLIKSQKTEIEGMVTASIERVYKDALKNSNNVLDLQNQIDNLTTEKRKIKDDLLDLKKAKELEKTEIEHLIALKEERMNLKMSQKEVELEGKYQQKELELRKKTYDEMVTHIEKVATDTKELYGKIMERLPNVNVRMKGGL